jgi:hypothetical protein
MYFGLCMMALIRRWLLKAYAVAAGTQYPGIHFIPTES